MGGVAYASKEQAEAKDRIVTRLFDWFSEQEPQAFEIADFQAICMDAGLMTDHHDFTPLGRAVFGMKQNWES
jgi:hypothetical protein